MPVGRRKGRGLQLRLRPGPWRHRGILLALLLHAFVAPTSAQFSGSGSALWPILGSGDDSDGGDGTTLDDPASGSGDYAYGTCALGCAVEMF